MDFPQSWSPFLTRSSLHLFELSVGFLRSWYIFLKIDALFKKSKITFYKGLGGAFLQSRSRRLFHDQDHYHFLKIMGHLSITFLSISSIEFSFSRPFLVFAGGFFKIKIKVISLRSRQRFFKVNKKSRKPLQIKDLTPPRPFQKPTSHLQKSPTRFLINNSITNSITPI